MTLPFDYTQGKLPPLRVKGISELVDYLLRLSGEQEIRL